MNGREYIVSRVAEQADTFDVYRDTSGGAYSGDPTKVDERDVLVFAPTSSAQVVVEGSGEETSLTGLATPVYDANDDLVHAVEVNDELRLSSNTSRRYDVRTKDPIADPLDPDLFIFGLERANASE